MSFEILSFFGPFAHAMHLVGIYIITGGISAILLFLMASIDKRHRKRDLTFGVIELAISLSGIPIIYSGLDPNFLLWIMIGMFVINGIYPIDLNSFGIHKISKRKRDRK